jgi:hypothetical protein
MLIAEDVSICIGLQKLAFTEVLLNLAEASARDKKAIRSCFYCGWRGNDI